MLLGNKSMFLPQFTYILLPRHKLCFENTVSAIMKTMRFTSFQCCSLTMSASNDERTSIADDEAEVEEPQKGHRKGKGKKEKN